jgi:hypothetical protein
MSEMVERIGNLLRDERIMGEWGCEYVAQKIIATMREPTEAIVKTGERVFNPLSPPQDWTLQDTKRAWQAMIDEALK